jgi:membrane-bound lytic murein transglycosylase D
MAKVDAMSFAEKQAMVGAAAPTPKVEVQPAPAGTTIHTVKQGESLWLIAKQYPGVTPEAIMKANGIGDKLQPGMKLKIPKGSK